MFEAYGRNLQQRLQHEPSSNRDAVSYVARARVNANSRDESIAAHCLDEFAEVAIYNYSILNSERLSTRVNTRIGMIVP